jgi:hypothetical protein
MVENSTFLPTHLTFPLDPAYPSFLELCMLCIHSPFWSLAPGRSPRPESTSVARGNGVDLRAGEEKLPASQAGTRHVRDAPGNRSRSYGRLAGIGFLRTPEHGFYRARESDRASWGSSLSTSHLGHNEACPTPVGPPGVVASVLPLCASSPSTPSGARAATRARGQSGGTTLSATDSGHGCRQNQPAMERARGARLPIAAGIRLRATEARGVCRIMSRGDW